MDQQGGLGEALAACVSLRWPSSYPNRRCKSLTGYKVPKRVHFKDELPKTNVGKILRRELKDSLKPQALASTLDLARRYHLSAYDASYLELALRAGLPLATLDADLAKAARKAGVKRFTHS